MADDQDMAEVPEDPDGERVGNLTFDDLDQGAAPDGEKDLVDGSAGTETDSAASDRAPAALEEVAANTESQ